MRVCISATGKGIDAAVDPRFGRCRYFLLVDTETLNVESLDNSAIAASGGAGIQAAQLVVNQGAQVVLTGDVGPNAFQALRAGGVKIVTGAQGTVKDVLERFKRGELGYAGAASAEPHAGMRR